MKSQFADITSLLHFHVAMFFLSIPWLVLELWQFLFIKDWPEIGKSEIPLSEFCPMPGDWGELGILNFARMYLIKCYWMLQNATVTAFTLSELLREKQQGLISLLVLLTLRTPWKNYIKLHNLSVIKRTTIFKEHLDGCFCVWKSVIKNFRELT